MPSAGSMAMHDERAKRRTASWASDPTPEERAAQLERDEALTTRDIRRAFVAAIAGCFFWLIVGLGLIGWALHTTDAANGQIALLAGLIIGYAGMTVTLARYYLKGEESGWW